MKKKIVLGIAVLAIAAVAAFNINLNTNQKSDMSLLALANVEALANTENNGTPVRSCYTGTIYKDPGAPTNIQPCNPKTSSSMIYPCPEEVRGRIYGYSYSHCTTN